MLQLKRKDSLIRILRSNYQSINAHSHHSYGLQNSAINNTVSNTYIKHLLVASLYYPEQSLLENIVRLLIYSESEQLRTSLIYFLQILLSMLEQKDTKSQQH